MTTVLLDRLIVSPGDLFGFAYPWGKRHRPRPDRAWVVESLDTFYGWAIALGCVGWPGSTPIHAAIAYDDERLTEAVGKPHIPPLRPLGATGGVILSDTRARLDHHLQIHKGRVWHYPLAHPLRPAERGDLRYFLDGQFGKPFDHTGQLWSRTFPLGFLWKRFWPFGLDHTAKWWCSKLVHAGLRATGVVYGPSWVWAPGPLLRSVVRYGIATCQEIILAKQAIAKEVTDD